MKYASQTIFNKFAKSIPSSSVIQLTSLGLKYLTKIEVSIKFFLNWLVHSFEDNKLHGLFSISAKKISFSIVANKSHVLKNIKNSFSCKWKKQNNHHSAFIKLTKASHGWFVVVAVLEIDVFKQMYFWKLYPFQVPVGSHRLLLLVRLQSTRKRKWV